jgi:HK97 family phage prohead protease
MHVRSDGYIEKATKLAEGEVEFIVSTNALDAYGERIDIDGIDLKDYKKNPVVLWGHDGFNLPIARATKVWKDGQKLMARAQFYMKDEFPRRVYQYIVDGFLNAVSIGGMVDEWSEDGRTISRMTMKEFSVVSIPANQEALVASKSLDNDEQHELKALANVYARKMLTTSPDEIASQINILEKMVATLKEVATSETNEDKAITKRVVLRQAQAVDKQTETIIRSIKLKDNINE